MRARPSGPPAAAALVGPRAAPPLISFHALPYTGATGSAPPLSRGRRNGLREGREDLDERPPDPLGAGDGARSLPRHSLRVLHFRRDPLLQDTAGSGRLPSARSRRPTVRRLQDLPHGDSVLARGDRGGDPGDGSRKQAGGLLHPSAGLSPLRVPRTRRIPR